MNLKEAAERLNISEVTARRWIKTGRLQAVLHEGAYGPEYFIAEESIELARQMQRTPVIIQTNEPTASASEIQRLIDKAITDRIATIIEDGNQSIVEEMQALKSELKAITEELAVEREKDRHQIENRDKQLMQVLRVIQERQQEIPRKFHWKNIFKRD